MSDFTRAGAAAATVAALASFLSVGCASIGPAKLVPTHEGYNDAVQISLSREVLKNLVRARYYDPPQFLSVASINAQFSVRTGARAGVGGIGAGTVGQAGGEIGYSESPTITYVPERGAGLYRSLFEPLRLPVAIVFFYDFGRVQPHEVAMVISSINYAQERAGPAGDRYRERLAALVRLFEAGAGFSSFREFQTGDFLSLPKAAVTARDLTEAAKTGRHFYDKGDGTVGLGELRTGIGLAVPLPHEGQTATDLQILRLTPGQSLYPVRTPNLARPAPLELQPDTLWLTTRSMDQVLGLMQLAVDVPREHEEAAIAPPADALLNTGVRLPMRIRHSEEEPAAPYRIRHRGYWFYIDETDLESKRLFQVAVEGYQSRLGSVAADAAPLISLPLGN